MFKKNKNNVELTKLMKKSKRGFFKTLMVWIWNIFVILGVAGGIAFFANGNKVEKGITYDYDYNSEIAFAEDYIYNYYSNSSESKKFIESHSMKYIVIPKLAENITVDSVKTKEVTVDDKNIYIAVSYRLNNILINSKIVMSKSKTNVVIEPLTTNVFSYKTDEGLDKKIKLDPGLKKINSTEDHLRFLQTFYQTANDNFDNTKQFYGKLEKLSPNTKYDIDSIRIIEAGKKSSSDIVIMSIDEVLYDNDKNELSRQNVTLVIELSLEINKVHNINRGGQ